MSTMMNRGNEELEGPNTPNRRDTAVEVLIESLKTRFPEKGFLLHPSLRFSSGRDKDHNAMGMGVTARDTIEMGQTLLVVPENSRLQSKRKVAPKELLRLHEKLTKKFRAEANKIEHLEKFRAVDETWLTVRVMNVLSGKNPGKSNPPTAMDPLLLQAATWPSEDEMKESYYGYWDEKQVEDIWGEKSGLSADWFDRIEKLNKVFDNIVYPLLKKEARGGTEFIDETLPSNSKLLQGSDGGTQTHTHTTKDLLRNTFWYADSLVFTRTHGTSENDRDCQIIPLVELFNGDVDGKLYEGVTSVNVALARGKWPFLGGGSFIDECNLPCSCVYALRKIEAGEELIISYGSDMTVNDFVMKYGAVPKSLLDPKRNRCDVRLWCKPAFLPKDPLRIACLEKQGFPLADFASKKESLTEIHAYGVEKGIEGSTSLQMYARGMEDSDIMSMRQFLILSVLADEFELNRNLTTGKLRGRLYDEDVLEKMCQMIDYNLDLLQGRHTGQTSPADMKWVRDRGTPLSRQEPLTLVPLSAWKCTALLARVSYRETLIAWRHAFVRKATWMMGKECEKHLYYIAHRCIEVGGRGCRICGKTYPALKCSRCKEVQYCSREHQIADWKDHKKQCGAGK